MPLTVPLPLLLTLSVYFTGTALNVAVTDLAAVMLTVQVLPAHAPPQPPKV